jgi:hypothetical protein
MSTTPLVAQSMTRSMLFAFGGRPVSAPGTIQFTNAMISSMEFLLNLLVTRRLARREIT